MIVKTIVLDRNQRILDFLGNVLFFDRYALFDRKFS